MSSGKKKLIEVALPLEAINLEAAREKSIRHGHPATLHLWWARRPLAAARAILFAQLVDDPSSHPDVFKTEEEQSRERARLFGIIEKLVIWENVQNESVLESARQEIRKSYNGVMPTILDPFAGGGSIPLEAQRLGLGARASDLNPVAVIINKATIEIPSKWRDQAPVGKDTAGTKMEWKKASGLAADVKHYGEIVKEKVQARVFSNYPSPNEKQNSFDVIAWLWVRTIKCPNPGCAIDMPLIRSWWLSKRTNKRVWIHPTIRDHKVNYELRTGNGEPISDGTVNRSGAKCISCEATAPLSYIRSEAVEQRMSQRLLATVVDSPSGRVYFEGDSSQEKAANVARPEAQDIDVLLSTHPQYMAAPRYGMTTTAQLFPNRQLSTALAFVEEFENIMDQIINDAKNAGMDKDQARKYAEDIKTYLVFALDKGLNLWSSCASWMSDREALRETFARQALSMVWDFAEPNPFGASGGSWEMCLDKVSKAIEALPANSMGSVEQKDARLADYENVIISTDPPYYDNVPYADLSDFFYPWLRSALKNIYPSLFATITTPKVEELVADHVRLGGKREAAEYFEDGSKQVFSKIVKESYPDSVTTVYYAFKQVDTVDSDEVAVSTGWETILSALINSGLSVTATWPVRTEGAGRIRSTGSNALATSIVLACRIRSTVAESMTRRSFTAALKSELPVALSRLQEANIAPVDLAQAAIGPGIAIFSGASRVLEVDGSDMSVRTALAIINQVLDEVLSSQESDFDSETRFCIKWFSQFGWSEAPFGEAEGLARAVNTSVPALERGGIFKASAGKARLLEPSQMSVSWDPAQDKSVSVWEVALRVAYALQKEGLERAATWIEQSKTKVDTDSVKELSYLIFSLAEKKGWNEVAILFNGLGTSWAEVARASRSPRAPENNQGVLEF